MRKLIPFLLLLLLAVSVQGQKKSQRVIYTSDDPPSTCVPGKLTTNSGLLIKKVWLGLADSSCQALNSGGTPGTVTSVSVTTANGISGSVATATTTPAISLDISGLNAAKIGGGGVSTAEFDFLGSVTSDIQTQINAKQATLTFGTEVQTALGVNVGSAGAPVLFNGAGGTPSSLVLTNASGTGSININGTVGATTPTTLAATTGTFTGDVTHSGAAIILSGNISGSGIFGTGGIRIKGVAATFNDTTSSGTVAAAYTDALGGNTLTATGATTITDYNTVNIQPATASTNVTVTRKHALGILDSTSASSSITGGLVVAATYGTAATSVGIGGGNINAGGTGTFGGALTDTASGAASTPVVALTGSVFTGGSGTTTKPLFLIEPTGTSSTTWNTAGTMIGLNSVTGFTGNFVDFKVNDTSRSTLTVSPALTQMGSSGANIVFRMNQPGSGSAGFVFTSKGSNDTFSFLNGLIVGPGSGADSTTALRFTKFDLSTNVMVIDTSTPSVTLPTAVRLTIASGTNTRAGNAVLVGGTVTVSNTTVTANTIVLLTRKTSGGTIGTSITYTLSASTSFTITSDNILDTSTFSYVLIENP